MESIIKICMIIVTIFSFIFFLSTLHTLIKQPNMDIEQQKVSTFDSCSNSCRALFYEQSNTWGNSSGVSEQKNACVNKCLEQNSIKE